ncbi:RNA-splicing ligase RtcB [candidate division WOR-3 bacterium JGI_Cruoil_03_44_89]|uniref:tRNA-splicing ligase RtcB n=1 Tax=candidate division WOR-3 bacterium JGI_Cruoil_03_44_89 TaxID=1973748 RepID=A0A235BN25_UNCW3|nr:MAG: RNA-splicing ligase RtcB [candidate division WOR-3 bacterium JGI_Cruoil_03_44_89]
MEFKQLDDTRWILKKTGGMRVPGLIFADSELLQHIERENVASQVANVAHLPGIVGYSLGMPDIHWGYGFPIGGVAGTRTSDGVISPGGVGYDINCGVRLLRTGFVEDEVRPHLGELLDVIYTNVPCGVGLKGKLRLTKNKLEEVLVKGARWMVENGFGEPRDLPVLEEGGRLDGADPSKVSKRAIERGTPQLGTLGAGNHFLEIQVVDRVYDPGIAERFGLFEGEITCMIHTGSRGFGHQVCDDYLRICERVTEKYHIHLPDKELSCAPIDSEEGRDYFGAMACAANFAWANRQCITHWIRESFIGVLGEARLDIVYDVAHNIAKIEKHKVDGETVELCVHRKGATRAFPRGHPQVPDIYRDVGQPVLIPGDMGTNSYILIGTDTAMKETFGSTCHGAGRRLSRHKAIKAAKGRSIDRELREKGILVRAKSYRTLMEEMPDAYKDIDRVVSVVERAGLSKKIARMKPIGVVKG